MHRASQNCFNKIERKWQIFHVPTTPHITSASIINTLNRMIQKFVVVVIVVVLTKDGPTLISHHIPKSSFASGFTLGVAHSGELDMCMTCICHDRIRVSLLLWKSSVLPIHLSHLHCYLLSLSPWFCHLQNVIELESASRTSFLHCVICIKFSPCLLRAR